jgi:hypothetical protein
MAALLPLMLWLSIDFGATWDEPQQRAKAHHLLSYWSGASESLEVPIDGAHLYGAPLDVVAAALEPVVPADPYIIRHGLIAFTGWAGIALAGLLALRLFGVWEAVVAVALLAANPFYIAHAMNNPKDLPFSTLATAWLVALASLPPAPRVMTPRRAILLAALLGVSLNIRAGALLFVGYLGALMLFKTLRTGVSWRSAASLGGWGLAVLSGGVALGWVAWPWAYDGPLTAPFRAMAELSHFPWGGYVLFDGAMVSGHVVPHGYVPQWFWMTLPPLVMAGAAASLLLLHVRSLRPQVVALWGVVLFPVIYVAGTRATLYDGVRHLLFVVPPLTVLAAAGLTLVARSARRPLRWLVLCAVGAGLLEPLLFQWRNHPNQAAYVQPLAGGPAAAYARYDLDYWGNCVLEAITRASARSGETPVAISGWPMIVLAADVTRVPGVTLVDERDPRARLFVRLARGNREELLRLGRSDAVVDRVTTADGALLCAVLSRREF